MQTLYFEDIRNDHIPEILKEIHLDHIYDPYFIGRKDLTVIDIGANIGLFTLYAYPFAKNVYAFEPAQQHFDKLTKMVTDNQLTNVTAKRVAISNHNGKAVFYHSVNSTMFSLDPFVKMGDMKQVEEEVDAMDIATALKDIPHIDFLKLDVEGEEMKILAGEEFDEASKKIDKLLIEWHAWTNTNPEQLRTMLIDRGYKVNQIKSEATLLIAEK